MDFYNFTATANQQIAITLTSSAFDAYLRLFDSNGNVLLQNDDGVGGTNARIPPGSGFVTLPAAGTYLIEVSAVEVNGVGGYTLNLTSSAQPTPTPTPSPRPVLAVSPASLNFGNVPTGQSASLALNVRNTGNAALNISSITSSDPQFTLSAPRTNFGLLPNGSVNLNETLNASANSFVATTVPVTVTAGQTLTQNLSLSPTLQQGEIRILLNWTKDGAGHPDDLDAHLIGPNPDGSCFHVWYDNLGTLNAAPFARLEVDNIRISGNPTTETVRIARLSPGIYRFYVHDFRDEKRDGGGLSRSRATVQIIGSSGQFGSFTVPGGTGLNWTVFEINGQTGAVTAINRIAAPATNCR